MSGNLPVTADTSFQFFVVEELAPGATIRNFRIVQRECRSIPCIRRNAYKNPAQAEKKYEQIA